MSSVSEEDYERCLGGEQQVIQPAKHLQHTLPDIHYHFPQSQFHVTKYIRRWGGGGVASAKRKAQAQILDMLQT